MTKPVAPPSNVTQTVPFLRVSDMKASLRFYMNGLGYDMPYNWVDDGDVRWCWLQRGGGGLMLQDFRQDGGTTWAPQGKLGLGVSIMFMCEDAIAIYREARSRGIDASTPVVGNGLWVTSMTDPDGYQISFESKTEVPEDTVFDG